MLLLRYRRPSALRAAAAAVRNFLRRGDGTAGRGCVTGGRFINVFVRAQTNTGRASAVVVVVMSVHAYTCIYGTRGRRARTSGVASSWSPRSPRTEKERFSHRGGGGSDLDGCRRIPRAATPVRPVAGAATPPPPPPSFTLNEPSHLSRVLHNTLSVHHAHTQTRFYASGETASSALHS